MAQLAPDLRKHFRRKSFPGVDVTQSSFVTVNGKSYTVVGQHIFLASPFYTYYDVLDNEGNPASIDIAEKIYSSVAMSQMITFMSKLKDQLVKPIEEQRKTTYIEKVDEDLSEQIRLKYKLKSNINIMELEKENTNMLFLFEQLESANKSLQEKHWWTKNDFYEFQEAWKAFWKVYQGRMVQLFKFYEYCNENKVFQDVVNGTQLDRIYQEAKEMFDVFTKSIPEDTPFVVEIDDFLTLLAQLGHEPYNTSKGETYKPVTAAFEYSLRKVYKVMLWGITPIVALLFIIQVVTFNQLIVASSITFGCYVTDLLVRSYLQSAAQKHLKKQRTNSISIQPIVQTTYKDVYSALQRKRHRKNKQASEEIYSFPAAHSDSGYGLILIGMMIIGFGFITKVASDDSYLLHYAVIGSVVALIGLILVILLRGKLYVTQNELTFRRMKFRPDNITTIWINRSGSKISIGILPRGLYIIKVPKRYRHQAKSTIIKWCNENGIFHLEDKRMRKYLKRFFIALVVIVFIFIFLFILLEFKS